MDIWDFLFFQDQIVLIGAISSLLCVFLMLLTYIVLPKWRTVQAYISVNEIVVGTISYWSDLSVYISMFGYIEYRTEDAHIFAAPLADYSEILSQVNESALLLSFCWSLCASIMAYVKLVRISTPRLSHEKKIATVFAVGVSATFELLNFIIKYIFVKDVYIENNIAAWAIDYFNDLAISVVSAINFVLYICICASVLACCSSMSRKGWAHVVSLIGVGLICQMTTVFFYVLVHLEREFDVDIPVLLYTIAFTLFHLRLVTSTLVVLCNRPTREQWKKYWRKLRNRAQDIPLRTRQQY